jgi:DNA replication protein DnaC
LEKSFDAFEKDRLSSILTAQVNALIEGSFVDRSENVLAFGNPGSGKTHLLCAIGQELILQGRRVLFSSCSLLVQQLLIAKRDLNLPRLLKRLRKYDALIIDDIGYVQQNREEMEILFILLAERYERGSLMITSNLPFSKWERIFKDPMTTAAAIDRLVHHSVILELNLPSFRLEHSKENQEN